jgi:methionyl-tRNA formyltransferase
VRAVFLGTPEAAVPSLNALTRVADIAAVITRPDRPQGRSKRPIPPPVKQRAGEIGLAVVQPTTSRDIGPILTGLGPIDVAVIVAFGMLIRPDALTVPNRGFVNVHFSILPRWRGAAPVQRAIEAGDVRTGVTLMRLDQGLDTGPVYSIRSTALMPSETSGDVLDRLASEGADHLASVLGDIVSGRAVATAQVGRPTHAPKITSDERLLDLATPAEHLVRKINALSPNPGASAFLDGDRFKILRARQTDEQAAGPGVMSLIEGRLIMGTATRPIQLIEVQPQGKRAMSGLDWARGRHGELGVLR